MQSNYKNIQEGCKITNIELVGGETAEMKDNIQINLILGFALGELLYNLPNKTKMIINANYMYKNLLEFIQ